MKKFLLACILLSSPLIIKAKDPEFKLTCPQKVSINSEFSCKIDINSEVKIKEVSATLNLGGNFNFIALNEGETFTKTLNNLAFVLKNEEGISGSFNLAILKLKMLKPAPLSIVDINIIDTSNVTYRASSIEQSIKALSNDNTLKSIKLSSGFLTPSFNSNITNYKIDVNVDEITINLEPNDSNAILKKSITQKLNYGVNNIKIDVQSESGITKTYTLSINRLNDQNSILKNVSLSVGQVEFDPNITNYTIELPIDTTNVKLDATISSDSEFVSGFEPRLIELNELETIALLKVKNKDEIKTYTFRFLKKDKSIIKELYIDETKINLDDDIYNYAVRVSKNASLKFKVILADEKSTYQIINNDLKDGNDIKVRVTLENGETKDYIFTITKIESESLLNEFICSNNSYIYYLIMFFLGIITASLICSLIYKRKMRTTIDKYIKIINEKQNNRNNENLFYQNKDDEKLYFDDDYNK